MHTSCDATIQMNWDNINDKVIKIHVYRDLQYKSETNIVETFLEIDVYNNRNGMNMLIQLKLPSSFVDDLK